MKNKQNIKSSELQIINGENQAAQLAVIAGLITILGDGLATVAAAMALQEAQQSQLKQVVQAWMDSPGHRENIMNASYTHIGVGFVENGYYWTQQFLQI